ncbi:MAG: T9SS type A sorting domain-containing protein [Crocinitomicaceae bacterium]|nr:T9SS type A sorting domain-containing protein [Crocinitomicaceae bacterium]
MKHSTIKTKRTFLPKTAIAILFVLSAAFNYSFGQCVPADEPILTPIAIGTTCVGDTVTITWTGNLNDNTGWVFYQDATGTYDTITGNSFQVILGLWDYIDIWGTGGGCTDGYDGYVDIEPNPSFNDIMPITICEGDSALIFGNYETTSGAYSDFAQTINGCDSTTTYNLTVYAPITEAVLPAQTLFCTSGTVAITVQSELNTFYYLHENSTDTLVDGPIMGTGGVISFDPGMVTTTTDYYVIAKRPSIGFQANGIDDYLSHDGPVLGGQANRTMECWFNWDGDTSIAHTLLYNGAMNQNGYDLKINTSGELYITFPNVGSLNSGYYVSPNEWIHVAAAVSPALIWTFYINGDSIYSGFAAANNPQGFSDFIVGNSQWATNEFDGIIDEVRMWSVERTQQEIQDNMHNCLVGNEPNLEAYYSFENGVVDLTANGYDLIANTNTNSYWVDGIDNCTSCDSELPNLATIAIDSITVPATVEICNGDDYIFGTQTLSMAGNYTELFVSSGGCDSTVNLALDVFVVDNGISVSGVTLTADATGATYQWVDCNNGNQAIIGETSQSFMPTVNGMYGVEVTVNGCTELSDCAIIDEIGMDELSNGSWVDLYPNPNNGSFTLELNGGDAEEIKIEIRNIVGQTVYSTNSEMGKKVQINLENISSGVYFVTVHSVHGQLSKQIVVQ